MRRFLTKVVVLLLVAVAAGCTPTPTSKSVYVPPSARSLMPVIREAVAYLNTVAPSQNPWTITETDVDELSSEYVLIRLDQDYLDSIEADGFMSWRGSSPLIRAVPDISPRAMAHELCHAAGLEHADVVDTENLMYPEYNDDAWELKPWQIEFLQLQ